MVSTADLARVCARRPWRVLVLWLVLLILAGVAGTGLSDAFTEQGDFTNKPESVRGDDLLKARMRGGADEAVTETVIVHSDNSTIDDPAFRQVVDRTAA